MTSQLLSLHCCIFNPVVWYPMIISTLCDWHNKNAEFWNRSTGTYAPEFTVYMVRNACLYMNLCKLPSDSWAPQYSIKWIGSPVPQLHTSTVQILWTLIYHFCKIVHYCCGIQRLHIILVHLLIVHLPLYCKVEVWNRGCIMVHSLITHCHAPTGTTPLYYGLTELVSALE